MVPAVVGGTPPFFAPEMCRKGAYNGAKADLWALGVSLYLMVFGVVPYMATTTYLLMQAILNQPVPWPIASSNTEDALLVEVLQKLLNKDPSERMPLVDLFAHPWLMTGGAEHGHPAEVERICISPDELADALKLTESFNAVWRAKVQFHKSLCRIRARRPLPDAKEVMFMVGEEREELLMHRDSHRRATLHDIVDRGSVLRSQGSSFPIPQGSGPAPTPTNTA